MKLLIFGVLAGLGQLARAADLEALPVQRFTANYGPGCHIAASLPPSRYGGLGSDPNTGLGGMAVNPIPKSWKSSLDTLGFGLSCRSANDSSATRGLAKLNKQTGLWEKNLDGWFEPPRPTGEERNELDKATRVLNIQAVNSKGYAGVREDTTGDEERRVRGLSFCLFHPPRAICGYGVVGMLRDDRKGDLTSHALRIIRSIEFLPDESEVQPSGATRSPRTDSAPTPDAKP